MLGAAQHRSAGDEERAQEAYVALCREREVAEACTAAELWEKGCDLGSLEACQGGMVATMGDAWLDYALGACALGDADTCWQIGVKASYRMVSPDLELASEAWEEGCELGHALSCVARGDLYRAENDYQAAAVRYDAACGDPGDLGCDLAADTRAVAADTEACAAGQIVACQRACPLVTDDAICAAVLDATLEACDHRDGEACTLLGHIYGKGRGVPRDFDRANVMLWLGCDLDDAVACLRLEDNLSHRRGAAPPGSRPIPWLRIQVCDLQMDYGCAPHAYWH